MIKILQSYFLKSLSFSATGCLSSGCHDRTPQMEWLKQYIQLCSSLFWRLKSKVPPCGFPVRAPRLLTCSPSLSSSSYEADDSHHEVPTLVIQANPNYLPEGPICKYNHISGLGFNVGIWVGHTNIQSTTHTLTDKCSMPEICFKITTGLEGMGGGIKKQDWPLSCWNWVTGLEGFFILFFFNTSLQVSIIKRLRC